METITLINGNGNTYTQDLPKIIIIEGHKWNDTARKHLADSTGLTFTDCGNGIEAQPIESSQIVALFMTYNFKSRRYDNWQYKNALLLKSDHHNGWDVNSICYDCCEHNHIHTSGMTKNDRLSC